MTNTAYLVGFTRPQKINYSALKICHGEPQNLANWPAESGKICRGKLYDLLNDWLSTADSELCFLFSSVAVSSRGW